MFMHNRPIFAIIDDKRFRFSNHIGLNKGFYQLTASGTSIGHQTSRQRIRNHLEHRKPGIERVFRCKMSKRLRRKTSPEKRGQSIVVVGYYGVDHH